LRLYCAPPPGHTRLDNIIFGVVSADGALVGCLDGLGAGGERGKGVGGDGDLQRGGVACPVVADGSRSTPRPRSAKRSWMLVRKCWRRTGSAMSAASSRSMISRLWRRCRFAIC
jgi:hypothetical protein